MAATQNAKLEGRIILTCRLVCKTGLHIGGSQEVGEIGTVDNIVVKDPLTQQPYVPGSSLKGKLRSLLEMALGLTKPEWDKQNKTWSAPPHTCGKPDCKLCNLFGRPGHEAGRGAAEEESGEKNAAEAEGQSDTSAESTQPATPPLPTRLRVEDAFLTDESAAELQDKLGDNIFTEIKWENAIDRLTSQATPRQFERVPKGAKFAVRMVLDVYQKEDKQLLGHLLWAMRLLEDSALGGSGSRGYGRVAFENIEIKWRPVSYYRTGEGESCIGKTAPNVAEALEHLPEEYKASSE